MHPTSWLHCSILEESGSEHFYVWAEPSRERTRIEDRSVTTEYGGWVLTTDCDSIALVGRKKNEFDVSTSSGRSGKCVQVLKDSELPDGLGDGTSKVVVVHLPV